MDKWSQSGGHELIHQASCAHYFFLTLAASAKCGVYAMCTAQCAVFTCEIINCSMLMQSWSPGLTGHRIVKKVAAWY